MALTWNELLDRSSRLHTTRTKNIGPAGTTLLHDDAQKLSVRLPDGRSATVIPTRLHEPGFYVVAEPQGIPPVSTVLRSPGALRIFQEWVEAGEVDEQ